MTGAGGRARPRLGRREAGDLVRAELAELARRSAQLDALRADPAWRQLADARPRGRTGELWRAARQGADAAESILAKAHRTLADAQRLLGPGPVDDTVLIRVDEALHGGSVRMERAELPKADQRPPWSTSTEPRFSLAEVKTLIDDDLRTARRLAADVAAVRSVVDSRLDELSGGLAEIRAAADPRTDAMLMPAIAAAQSEIDVLHDLAANDPLALRSGADGAPALARFDAIGGQLAVLRDGLAASSALRARIERRVARLAAALDELAAVESHARDLRAAAALRVAVGIVPAAPGAAGTLRGRLRAVEARLTSAWRTVADEVDAIAEAADAALAGAQAVIAWASGMHDEPAPDPDRAADAAPSACVRPDCPGGPLDADGICELCFRAPASTRAPAATAKDGGADQAVGGSRRIGGGDAGKADTGDGAAADGDTAMTGGTVDRGESVGGREPLRELPERR